MAQKPQKLYHYTSLDSFSKIWVSGHLLFANSKGTNDIFESKKVLSIGKCTLPYNNESTQYEVMGHFNKMFWDEVDKYKQISLVKDYSDNIPGYSSPMMWGHYAERGKGVCIEIDLEQIIIPKNDCYSHSIRYTKNVPIIDLNNGEILSTPALIQNFIKRNIHRIFFNKHNHWKFENEYRIISKTLDYLDIKKAITCVYIYHDLEDVEYKIVKKLLEGSDVDIKLIMTAATNTRKITAFSHIYFKE